MLNRCIPLLRAAAAAAVLAPALALGADIPTLSTSVATQGYRLRSGDQIRIEVADFPDLSKEQAVLPDGTISVLYIGAVRAAGRTPEELSETLVQQFKGILRKPIVSVAVLRTRPLRVNVIGEVMRPGPHVFVPPNARLMNPGTQTDVAGFLGPETLTGALTLAGGLTPNADVRRVTLVRQTSDGPKEKTIDLWAALSSGDFTGDVQLTDGDTIKVPTAEADSPENQQIADAVLSSTLAPSQVQVQVVGEVKQAGVVNLQPRTNSVLNAIALAGGPTNEADFRNIAVARLARSGKVERFPLDYNKLADGSQTFNVRTGDVILVGRRGDRQAAEDTRSFLGPVGDVLRILFFPFRIFF